MIALLAPIIHRDIQQGTPEWFGVKAGVWSASKAPVIMGGLETRGLAALIQDLAWERVHGASEGKGFKSAAMDRGTDLEPLGCDWFAQHRGVIVEQVGFVIHAALPTVGWSPDRLYAEDRRGIEVKCPLDKAWFEVQRTGKVPSQYRWQTRWGQWVGQLESLEFVAWHPNHGGLIVPCEVTEIECEQMAERVALLEPKVMQRVDELLNARKACKATWLDDLIADPEVSF